MLLRADRSAARLQRAVVYVRRPERRRSVDAGHHGCVRAGRQMGATETSGRGIGVAGRTAAA